MAGTRPAAPRPCAHPTPQPPPRDAGVPIEEARLLLVGLHLCEFGLGLGRVVDRSREFTCLFEVMDGHYYMHCLNRQARTSLTTSAIVFCSAWSILWVCGYGGGTLSVTAHRGISDATAATRTMQTSQHTHQAGHVLLGKVGEVELLLDGHGELDEVCCARTDGRR